MPSKDSRVVGVRLSGPVIKQIQEKAMKRGWTFNRWMNWAAKEGLRPHIKTRVSDASS